MPGTAIVLSFIKSYITAEFLAQFTAEKAFDGVIDSIRTRLHDNEPLTVEEELLVCLNMALKEVCEKYGWEFDGNAIGETFISSWRTAGNLARLNSSETAEAFEKILTEAIGMPIDGKILEFWTQRVMEDISGFPHLNNYFVQSKLDVIADSTNQIMETSQRILHGEIGIPDTTTKQLQEKSDSGNADFDYHIELTKKFNELFPREASMTYDQITAKNTMPHYNKKEKLVKWLESLSAVEQWNFKYARELLYYQTTGEYKDFWEIYNEDNAEIKPQSAEKYIESEDDKTKQEAVSKQKIKIPSIDDSKPVQQEQGGRKYFSIYEPERVNSVIYQIDKVALPDKHKIIYFPTRLDTAGEFLEGGGFKRTFFVDHPSPSGNHLVVFTFDEGTSEGGYVVVNSGFLDGDIVKISRAPTVLKIRKAPANTQLMASTDIDFPGFTIDQTIKEPQKYKYTFDIENTIIVLDSETTEEIKPVFDDNSDVGSIEVKPYKRYFAFSIRPRDAGDIEIDDYELGCAFKYGRYRMKIDYRKAVHYLELAEIVGNMKAKAELVEMYEKGIGCSVNMSKANRLRREIEAYNNQIRV